MSESKRFRALYDEQCEICQAGVTWLRALDRESLVDAIPLDPDRLASVDSRLDAEACARELHVIGPDGEIWAGGAAVRRLARLFPATWIVGTLLELPVLRSISDLAYDYVADHRYQMSKCRGGACRTILTERPSGSSDLRAFWTCYSCGFLIRLPLAAWFAFKQFVGNALDHLRTRERRFVFLNGKLQAFFLSSASSELVPLLFGERFWMLRYDGLLIDPGGPRMARSVRSHLQKAADSPTVGIVATHAHEEHIGNLELASDMTRAPAYASAACLPLIRTPHRIPRMRALVIGQPRPFERISPLSAEIKGATTSLRVFPAPGHSDDHIVLYDPREKLLLSGDAFMGAYFSSPNPDVDSRRWVESLKRLLELPIEVMLTGHGQIFTLRTDFEEIPGVVIRRAPEEILREKLDFLGWVERQVASGAREGLPSRAIEATLFPWNRSWSWENLFTDELARVLSAGEFSRSQLVRSFSRGPESVDPQVYEMRGYSCRDAQK